MSRIAAYCRVSLEEQVEQFGLASQLRAVREHAAARGESIPEELVFVDQGFSGADLERPALSRLRELIRTRQISAVLVHDPDRLARKLGHQALILEECQQHGVTLQFVTTPTADTPEAVMFLQLKGAFSEYERAKINERTLRGRREKARQGFIVGGRVAYGYRYLGKRENERGRLVIDEEQAEVVRQIFTWAADGVSLRGITSRLNSLGIPSQRTSHWGRSAVARLLKYEGYVGKAHYNKGQRVLPPNPDPARKDKKTRRRMRERAEWIPIQIPQIVPEELFDAVRERLEHNLVAFRGRPAREYLLTGLLWCPCGKRFGAAPSQNQRFYRCMGRDRQRGNGCHASIVYAPRIERAIWDQVSALFVDPKTLRALVSQKLDQLVAPDSGEKLVVLQKRLARLQKREFRIAQALLDAELADHFDRFKTELKATTRERASTEREIRELEAGQARSKNVLSGVEALCRQIREAIRDLDFSCRKQFLARVVDRIEYSAGVASVCCLVPDMSVPSGRRRPLSIDLQFEVA